MEKMQLAGKMAPNTAPLKGEKAAFLSAASVRPAGRSAPQLIRDQRRLLGGIRPVSRVTKKAEFLPCLWTVGRTQSSCCLLVLFFFKLVNQCVSECGALMEVVDVQLKSVGNVLLPVSCVFAPFCALFVRFSG